MTIKKNYFFALILFFGTTSAMDNQKEKSDLLLPKVLSLPPDLVQKIGFFTLGNNPLITWLYNQKLELLSETHQDLSIKNGQLATYVQQDHQGKWQHVENGNPHLPLSFEKKLEDETDWLYDGPNIKNMMLVAAIARKELSSSQEETSTIEHTSLLYLFPYQPVNKFVRLSQELPCTNIIALALGYKNNYRAIAIRNDDNSDIVLSNEGNEIKKITIKQCFIKRLMFLSHRLLYALSEQGDMYALDCISREKATLQTFKDKNGASIKIEDFVIDTKYRTQGALISNKKFYLVDVLCKKFIQFPIPDLNLEQNTGLCRLKAFDDKVGIFMRNYDQYTVCLLNVARMALEKINAR